MRRASTLLLLVALGRCAPGPEAEVPVDAPESLREGGTNTPDDTLDAGVLDAEAMDADPADATGEAIARQDAMTLPDATIARDVATLADVRGSDAPAPTTAFLHADLWSIFWNDRTRCGAERAFAHQCERRGGDCATPRRAVEVCDPARVIYGQVGPERQGERLCQRGRFPDIGGCDARRYDFERLRFWWYGAEWQGNWPFATLKVFAGSVRDPRAWGGAGLVAFSSLPGRREAAMEGVANHGLDRDGDGRADAHACAMTGVTSGDAAYRRPFGGFAWIEVPAGVPLTVVAAAGTNFAGRTFEGCSRGAPTQSPWLTGSPGATLGCVYALEQRFDGGRHYVFRHGRIEALPSAGPPPEIVAGFALPDVGLDVRTRAPCERPR